MNAKEANEEDDKNKVKQNTIQDNNCSCFIERCFDSFHKNYFVLLPVADVAC